MNGEDVAFKDQGNAEFKAGNWLKAAALYSKGLKSDPKNAVLLSNRSAAFLKLNKAQKALADAEECIRQKPEWDKGYYRLGAVLEATKEFDKALEAFQRAAKLNPDSKEVTLKVKSISRLAKHSTQGGSRHVNGHSEANGKTTPSPTSTGETPELVNGTSIPYSPARLEEFTQQIFQIVEKEIQSRTFERTFPCVFFLPGKLDKDGVEKMGQVSIQAAFDSPTTLANATNFLREYGHDTSAQAALAVIPKHKIAYPQVWQKPGWTVGKADGFFVQMEGPKLRKLWFIPLGQKSREPVTIHDKFAVLEKLFR